MSPSSDAGVRRRYLGQVFSMITALSAASVLNVVYVTVVARSLDAGELGVFFCAHSILLMAAAPGGAVQTFLAGLHASSGEGTRSRLFRAWAKRLGGVGVALFLVFLLLSPLLAPLLRIPSLGPVAVTGVALGAYAMLPLLYGRLQGDQRFSRLGATLVLEAAVRPAAALLLSLAAWMHATTAVGTLALGYVVASFVALLLGGLSPLRRERGGDEGLSPPSARGLLPTVAALLALAAFTYVDVLFAQRYFGASSTSPGAPVGNAGAYGAAAYIGRAFIMVTLPLVMVMFPRVASARGKEEGTWLFLRDALIMTIAVWGLGFAFCAAFPTVIAGALFPDQPGSAALISRYPLAVLPYMILALLVYYQLALRRWKTAWILVGGVLIQWAGYLVFHRTPFDLLAVLGVTGGVTVAATGAITLYGRGRTAKDW